MLDFECVVAIVEEVKRKKVVEDAKAEGARGIRYFMVVVRNLRSRSFKYACEASKVSLF